MYIYSEEMNVHTILLQMTVFIVKQSFFGTLYNYTAIASSNFPLV